MREDRRRAQRGGNARDCSEVCSLSNSSSVLSQPMHGSVIDTPYSSVERSFGMRWLPAFKWLSSIRPTIERLPSRI